jgi:hypothetical protein
MTAHGSSASRSDGGRSLIRTAATLVALTFLAVGILGFIPGITSNYDELEIAGHESHAKLLGIFEVSVLHNVVHLLFGAVGLALARTVSGSRSYLIGGGVVYLVLWLYGLLIDVQPGGDSDFVPFNEADNWLHLGLGLAMIGLGVALSRDRTRV